jgi:hypothetical protein
MKDNKPLGLDNGTIPSWAKYMTANIENNVIVELHYYRHRPDDFEINLDFSNGIEATGYEAKQSHEEPKV